VVKPSLFHLYFNNIFQQYLNVKNYRRRLYLVSICRLIRSVCQLLLNKGVDSDTRDRDGLSPMMWACRWDRIEHFDMLSKHSEMERRTKRNRQNQGAFDENGLERDDSGRTYFHWSVRRIEPLECLAVSMLL